MNKFMEKVMNQILETFLHPIILPGFPDLS